MKLLRCTKTRETITSRFAVAIGTYQGRIIVASGVLRLESNKSGKKATIAYKQVVPEKFHSGIYTALSERIPRDYKVNHKIPTYAKA